MANTDTSPAARRRHIAVWAALDGEEKVAVAAEMAEQAKEVAVSGIRSRAPHLSDDEVAVEWIRILHGEEVAARIA